MQLQDVVVVRRGSGRLFVEVVCGLWPLFAFAVGLDGLRLLAAVVLPSPDPLLLRLVLLEQLGVDTVRRLHVGPALGELGEGPAILATATQGLSPRHRARRIRTAASPFQ